MTRRDPHLDLVDDARHAQAVADRSQRRLLLEADEQDATFRSSLEQLAESGGEVVLETTVGRIVRGSVRALAADHVVVTEAGATSWVRLDAATVLRVPRGGSVRAGGGDRAARAPVALVDALRGLVEDRQDVEVVFEGGGAVRGTAAGAGRDVLVLRDTVTGSRALVHLARAVLVVARHA